MTKIPNSTLAWETITRDGYGKLDLRCVVFDNKTVMVKRMPPNDPDAGKFVGFLDADRISDRAYASRMEAIAEAERFVYDQPQFANSNSGAAVKAAIAMGFQGYLDGQSIYANPYTPGTNDVDRQLWVAGWLEAHTRTVTEKLRVAAEATARANNQLESDNVYMVASVRAYRLAINFVALKTGDDGDWKPREGIAFLVEWMTSNDAEAFAVKYPEWKEYYSNDPRATTPKPPATN